MTRKQALAIIRADAAENGQLSALGVRVFIENRISYDAMREAVEQGRKFGEFIRQRDAARDSPNVPSTLLDSGPKIIKTE